MKKLAALLTLALFTLPGCKAGNDNAAMAQTAQTTAGERGTSSQASLVARRVWVGYDPNLYATNPSPDGRYVSEIDWTTGDLAIRNLANGEIERITDKGPWSESNDYAEASVFSRDGQQLAYAWFNEQAGYELRAIGIDGSAPRVLMTSDWQIPYLFPEDWSPDGAFVLATIFRPDRTNQLTVVASDGSGSQVLKTFDWRYALEAAFSPDGRFIAYDFEPDEDSEQRDIYALAVDGSREIALVEGQGNDRLLGWVPGGHNILFYSDRSGTPGIWTLPVSDGRPASEPQLLKSDVWRLFPLGFSRDAYFYAVTLEQHQVHTATIDLAPGRLLSPPMPVGDPTTGLTRFSDWSPDGKKLAYLAHRPDRSRWHLVIRSVGGSETRQIPLDVQPRDLLWTPNGKAVVIRGRGDKGRIGLWRIDLANGTASLYGPSDSGVRKYAFSPDGRTLYLRGWAEAESGPQAAIWAHDIESGRRAELQRVNEASSGNNLSVSPDGQLLAFTDFDRSTKTYSLSVLPSAGGQARLIFTTPVPNNLGNRSGLPWTPDGQHILFIRHGLNEAGDRVMELLKIGIDGGEPQKLMERELSKGQVRHVRLHPDGRRIAFDTGRAKGEIWVLENLPGIASATETSH